jgi:hypothetical protein
MHPQRWPAAPEARLQNKTNGTSVPRPKAVPQLAKTMPRLSGILSMCHIPNMAESDTLDNAAHFPAIFTHICLLELLPKPRELSIDKNLRQIALAWET